MLRNLLLNLKYSSCWYVQYWYSSLSKWRCMAPSRAGRASTIINKKKKKEALTHEIFDFHMIRLTFPSWWQRRLPHIYIYDAE
jgi:hypothetical protein